VQILVTKKDSRRNHYDGNNDECGPPHLLSPMNDDHLRTTGAHRTSFEVKCYREKPILILAALAPLLRAKRSPDNSQHSQHMDKKICGSEVMQAS
jgi:hypothetical protein